MFPYGMEKNDDDTWTLFNRNYKPVGVVSTEWREWREWNNPDHKINLKGLTERRLLSLDVNCIGEGSRIYFYNDATNPENSAKDMNAYFDKMKILMVLGK